MVEGYGAAAPLLLNAIGSVLRYSLAVSFMLTVAEAGEPKVVPDPGLEMLRPNVSTLSTTISEHIGI
jgi:hypothetical protein